MTWLDVCHQILFGSTFASQFTLESRQCLEQIPASNAIKTLELNHAMGITDVFIRSQVIMLAGET